MAATAATVSHALDILGVKRATPGAIAQAVSGPSAVAARIAFASNVVRSGCAEHSRATRPAMCGAAKLLPVAMQVFLPDGSRHEYMFDVANATINSPFARLQSLFSRPRTPGGWQRVVEQPPLQQAAQPAQPAR